MEIILLKINYSNLPNVLVHVVVCVPNGVISGRTIQKKGRCVACGELVSR